MNKLNEQKRAQVLAVLVEGNSIRATCRMTGVVKNTVVKLLVDIGAICSEYQDKNGDAAIYPIDQCLLEEG